MEDEQLPLFNSIKHRSIASVNTLNTSITDRDTSQTPKELKVIIPNILLTMKAFIFVGIIPMPIGSIMILIEYSVIKGIGYIILFSGGFLFSYGIYLCFTIKYIFEFYFIGPKLKVKIIGFCCPTTKEYLISKLDYIIIDQMHVENDDEGEEEIPAKIVINSIEEGYDEIFSGSGKPPLFTNDEVQFFNQFMKININKTNK